MTRCAMRWQFCLPVNWAASSTRGAFTENRSWSHLVRHLGEPTVRLRGGRPTRPGHTHGGSIATVLRRIYGRPQLRIERFLETRRRRQRLRADAHNRRRCDAHSSATQWRHRFNLDITLEKGSITLSGILSGSKSYGAETLTVARLGEDDMGDPLEQTTRYNTDPSWRAEIDEFANAIRKNGAIIHGSADDAYRTMELVYRIYCADPEWRTRWGLRDPAAGSETENE